MPKSLPFTLKQGIETQQNMWKLLGTGNFTLLQRMSAFILVKKCLRRERERVLEREREREEPGAVEPKVIAPGKIVPS